MIYHVDNRSVEFKSGRYFVANNATVVGSVVIGNNVSVWFNAVIRGDSDPINVGDNSNIQDAAVLHADPGYPLDIGEGVTVGHKVMLHGCTIGDNSLIGINAVVLNGAKIGKNCLIGANTLISEGMEVPDGSLVVGTPGRIRRTLSEQEIDGLRASAEHYVSNMRRYRQSLVQVE
ncbi:gamma carbonic anhydrase family protein [Motiliproteus sp. MSK22-1]|uniref:gamma carbonic anhydrase family protein n=1 Tax=Motiliproteus sp. MSK22-1 TaxID=1897630 RepID=UPI0009780CF1|nr:gamma carbonic anhydrase family protein [Motiliproteus sp. MSK22-1]OMH35309.1 gamma carbonic anhydrase family protein [Motiliproteus sp. MSK22-1]